MRWLADSSAVIFRSSGQGATTLFSQSLSGGPAQALPEAEIRGYGYHLSFSPDRSRIMDVTGHKVLWTFPVEGGRPEKVFEFEDSDARIDYPVWSPDGKWVMFDRAIPQGGDIWLLSGLD